MRYTCTPHNFYFNIEIMLMLGCIKVNWFSHCIGYNVSKICICYMLLPLGNNLYSLGFHCFQDSHTEVYLS